MGGRSKASGATTPRAAGYVRLSVATEDTQSPETQRDDIVRYIERQGWVADLTDADIDSADRTRISGGDIYVDLGYSGSKASVVRPAFDALMKNLDHYDRVVVWKIDRLTRRLAQLGDLLETFAEHRVALIGLSDGVDTSTAAGRTTAEILGAIAAAESRNTKQRVEAAQRTMLKKGMWRGGPPPFGYRIERLGNGEGSRLVIDETQAPFLREAVRRFLKGESVGKVCDALNAKGSRSVKGNPWSEPVLRRLLGSPALAGFQVLNGEIVNDDHGNPVQPYKGIITTAKYNELQEALRRRAIARPTAVGHGGALLSGFVFCGLCGGRMIGSSSLGSPSANYRCRSRFQLHKDCTGVAARAKFVEAFVTSAFLELLSEPSTRARLRAALVAADSNASKALDDARVEVAFRREELQKLQDRRRSGKYNFPGGDDEYDKEWDLQLEHLNAAEARVKAAAPAPPTDPKLAALLTESDVKAAWEALTRSEARQALQALIKRVTIKPVSPDWNSRHGFDYGRIVIETTWQPPGSGADDDE